ncbi:MAG: hypothetical protein U0802_20650 [Candidatus Binatia bacterium]
MATDGATLDPDVVVILLNPLDFLNPSFERDLKPQVRAVLPPLPTLQERGAFISTVAGKLDLVAASISRLYRYRAALRSCIEDHLRWAWHWLRGGRATPAFGWYADGYTQQAFAVAVAADAGAFEYYIDPAWIAQRGRVRLTFADDDGVVAERTETAPGWKTLVLPRRTAGLLAVSADSAWSPRAAGARDDTRLLGVRLREVPTTPPSRSRAPVRYPPLERQHPDALLRMEGASGEAFARKWEALLEADTEFGRRFRAYRDTKLAQRDMPLTPTGEYAELERLVQTFTARGARVLLVNNPESELMRAQYVDRPYYRSYLAFLAGVAARNPGVRFEDLGGALPIDDFNDWHHVTFVGTMKLGPRLAGLVHPLLEPAGVQP